MKRYVRSSSELITREYLENIIHGCKTDKQVRDALSKAGITSRTDYKDEPTEINDKLYLSIWIGNFRIYKPMRRKEYEVQEWNPVEFKSSGIPTFNPSGNPDTFNTMF